MMITDSDIPWLAQPVPVLRFNLNQMPLLLMVVGKLPFPVKNHRYVMIIHLLRIYSDKLLQCVISMIIAEQHPAIMVKMRHTILVEQEVIVHRLMMAYLQAPLKIIPGSNL